MKTSVVLFFSISVYIACQAFFELHWKSRLRRRWAEASLTPSSLGVRRWFLCGAWGAIGALLPWLVFQDQAWLALAGGAFGVWVPFHIVREERRKRTWANWTQFPDFLELLAMGLSAGITLEKSWELASGHLPEGSLRSELIQAFRSMEWGQSREEAFHSLQQRLDDSRVSSVLVLIHQGMKRGVSLHSLLLDLTESMRLSASLTVEKKAHTMSIRLLFPIMIFIFPSLFIILFGALFLQYLQNGAFVF